MKFLTSLETIPFFGVPTKIEAMSLQKLGEKHYNSDLKKRKKTM